MWTGVNRAGGGGVGGKGFNLQCSCYYCIGKCLTAGPLPFPYGRRNNRSARDVRNISAWNMDSSFQCSPNITIVIGEIYRYYNIICRFELCLLSGCGFCSLPSCGFDYKWILEVNPIDVRFPNNLWPRWTYSNHMGAREHPPVSCYIQRPTTRTIRFEEEFTLIFLVLIHL